MSWEFRGAVAEVEIVIRYQHGGLGFDLLPAEIVRASRPRYGKFPARRSFPDPHGIDEPIRLPGTATADAHYPTPRLGPELNRRPLASTERAESGCDVWRKTGVMIHSICVVLGQFDGGARRRHRGVVLGPRQFTEPINENDRRPRVAFAVGQEVLPHALLFFSGDLACNEQQPSNLHTRD
jgi:hypothetical protein